MPDVDHLGPLLDLGVDTRGARSSAETDRVVEQHFFAADVNEQRGQVPEISEERRDQRRLAVAGADIGLRQGFDAVARHDRIRRGLRGVAGAAAGEIDPW